MGRVAALLGPAESGAHGFMAVDYLRLRDWAAAARECRAALALNPHDADAHEALGEAYAGLHRLSEARTEWRTVLALDHGQTADTARRMLAGR